MLNETKNYIWIKHPFTGRNLENTQDKKEILEWLQEKHNTGFEPIGILRIGDSWIFKKRPPNSVNFIKGK